MNPEGPSSEAVKKPPETDTTVAPPPPPAGLLDAGQLLELDHTWGHRPGLWGWLINVDHKSVGKRYIVTALIFMLLAGLLALLMRIQLARPQNDFLGPDLYNQFFTTHGTTMMFLFAVPMVEAVGIYLVPLMIGTRNVAFPRLNLMGYYVYLLAGVLLYTGLLLNSAPDTGWFSYVPLSGPEFSPGKRVDVWAQTITLTEIAALIAAVELIVTIFRMRAPGMSLNRMPLFVWAMLVMSFMVIFAMPVVAVNSLFLSMDRLPQISTRFFDPQLGGDPLLWQHLFWFFGHPEVYIIFIPALGMVSAVIAALTQREIFGYPVMVLALVATAFMGFGLWVHHMFATPLPNLGQSFFTAASVMIAIPSGAQIFCWIATIWAGRPRLRTPLLFMLGFVVLFVMGGITGVMIASIPFDSQSHDTFFVVAHFHFVLIGGSVFPLFGALYYWFPKFTGRMYNEPLGKWHFWLFFIGMNVTFWPMHHLGFMGMPRRVHTYLEGLGWGELNLLATVGAFIIAGSVLIFLLNMLISMRQGEVAGPNPWGASSLEWEASSPPEGFNFRHLPTVRSRDPLWDADRAEQPVVTGLREDRREVLVTDGLDAIPDHRLVLPRPTLTPFLTALAISVAFIGVIFQFWVPVGAVLFFITLTYWNWPRQEPRLEGPDGPEHELARLQAQREGKKKWP